MVGRKYYVFLQVCLGIWTAEAVEVYELEHICSMMTNTPIDEVLASVISETVGSRAILFQAFGFMALFSVYVILTAGAPLFIQPSAALLRDNLPGLIVPWSTAWEMATRREISREYGSHNVDLKDVQ